MIRRVIEVIFIPISFLIINVSYFTQIKVKCHNLYSCIHLIQNYYFTICYEIKKTVRIERGSCLLNIVINGSDWLVNNCWCNKWKTCIFWINMTYWQHILGIVIKAVWGCDGLNSQRRELNMESEPWLNSHDSNKQILKLKTIILTTGYSLIQ